MLENPPLDVPAVAMTPVAAEPPRRPGGLAEAAAYFAEVCQEIEDNDALPKPRPLTDLVKQRFGFLKTELARHVDLGIGFKNACDDFIAGCEKRERALRYRRKQIEETLDLFKVEVKDAVQAHPNQPYRGVQGGIKLQKNGGKAALKLRFVEDDKQFSHCIDPQAVELFEVPAEFIETITVTRLNTEAVRQALGTGAEFPWAQLERGMHVRFD